MRFTHQTILLSNEFLKQYGISIVQFDELIQISTFEPLTQTELAEKVTITYDGISRVLTRLGMEQLIERKQNWKTKTISLTDKGRQNLKEHLRPS